MTSPMMLVAVLTVLWLIVVVPMIVRRSDDAGQRLRSSGFRASRFRASRGGSVVAPSTAAGTAIAGAPTGVSTAAEEAPMFLDDDAELSAARRRMMARRRRSLSVLIAGSLVAIALGVTFGGIAWVAAGAFVVALSGYLLFLRKQAVRDRDRRAVRASRAARSMRSGGLRAVPSNASGMVGPDAVVRIDDDDIALHALDTVDLTGLYDAGSAPAGQRRAG